MLPKVNFPLWLSGEKERRQQTLFALLTRCPEEWRCAAKLAAMCYCIAEKYTCTKKNNLCKCRWGITSTTSCRLAQGSKRCTPQHHTPKTETTQWQNFARRSNKSPWACNLINQRCCCWRKTLHLSSKVEGRICMVIFVEMQTPPLGLRDWFWSYRVIQVPTPLSQPQWVCVLVRHKKKVPEFYST